MTAPKRLLITASTFPASDSDPVPAFVKDQAIWFSKQFPDMKVDVLAPHNAHSKTRKLTVHPHYNEYRFHYFWPFKWEILAGRGIAPALKKNKLLYIQVPLLLVAETVATYRLIRKQKPELVYAHWFMPQGITSAVACMLTKTPFVFTSHSGDVIVLRKLPLARHLVKWVCKRANAYTAVSQQTADKLFSMLPDKNIDNLKDKLAVIPMGTNLDVSQQAKKRSENYTQLFFIGRLVRIKGVDLLLQALAELRKTHKFKLSIAGDGQHRAELEQLTRELGLEKQVSFQGFVSGAKKQRLFDEADVVCIPSIKEGQNTEGLPVVLMESLAASKIVLASDVTGAQEYLSDTKDGFLFEQGSVSSLQDSLQTIFELSDKERKDIQKSAQTLSKVFDWPIVIKQHAKHFFKEGAN